MGNGIYTGKRIKTKDGVLTQSALSFYMDEVYDLNDAVWAVNPTTQFLYFFKSLHNNNRGNDPFLDTTRQHWDFIYTDQIQITNPYSLGMTIKSSSSISNPSWLKSDAIVKNGAVYVSMYNKLLDVNTNGTTGTFTTPDGNIYNTKEKDGFVVISATDWQTIYSNYGAVVQFGIDTTNQQFYLPYNVCSCSVPSALSTACIDYYYVGETIQNQSIIDISKVLQARKYTTELVGDGSTTEFYVDHNLNSWDVYVAAYDMNNFSLSLGVQLISENRIKITFGSNSLLQNNEKVRVVVFNY